MKKNDKKYLALSGGVGGAKLALGLSKILKPDQLTIVANTGDDFTHMGLYICPDIDSIIYGLAGMNDTQRGWGIRGETWEFLGAVKKLGGPDWFQLGDKDLATHILRTSKLHAGQKLTEVTKSFCSALGIDCKLLPMTDDKVDTIVHTADRSLEFQKYFVELKCEPVVTGFEFKGRETARPNAEFMHLLKDPDLAGIIICPSNPYVSIDPILSLPGVKDAISRSHAPVLAVSPIIEGQALKGPAAKMLKELGEPVTAYSIAKHYSSFLDIFVHDLKDENIVREGQNSECRLIAANTIMNTLDDKTALAQRIISIFQQEI